MIFLYNSGILSNALTIPAESVSAEISGIVESRPFRQTTLPRLSESSRKCQKCRDCQRFLPELRGLSKMFIFWLILTDRQRVMHKSLPCRLKNESCAAKSCKNQTPLARFPLVTLSLSLPERVIGVRWF